MVSHYSLPIVRQRKVIGFEFVRSVEQDYYDLDFLVSPYAGVSKLCVIVLKKKRVFKKITEGKESGVVPAVGTTPLRSRQEAPPCFCRRYAGKNNRLRLNIQTQGS